MIYIFEGIFGMLSVAVCAGCEWCRDLNGNGNGTLVLLPFCNAMLNDQHFLRLSLVCCQWLFALVLSGSVTLVLMAFVNTTLFLLLC